VVVRLEVGRVKTIDEFLTPAADEVAERIARKRHQLAVLDAQIARIEAVEPDAFVADLIAMTADLSLQIRNMERVTYMLAVAYELREADRYRSGRRKPPADDV
jgi:hypothetical protein